MAEHAPMRSMEAFRQAVAEIGHVPAETLCLFIKNRYGIKIEPKYVPLFHATLLDLEKTRRKRPAQISPAASLKR